MSQIKNFEPSTNLIIPVGLYINEVLKQCDLIYPVKNEDNTWYFPEKWGNLNFHKPYDVFSPSMIPLPPEVRLYYTIVKNSDPRFIVAIREVYDSFDIEGLFIAKKTSAQK